MFFDILTTLFLPELCLVNKCMSFVLLVSNIAETINLADGKVNSLTITMFCHYWRQAKIFGTKLLWHMIS